MNDIVIAVLVTICVFASGVCGLLLYPLLPRRHLTNETRDAIRAGIGMISLLASLVLGLLTGSAKGTHDNVEQQVRSYAADLIELDQTLRNYGANADPIRKMLFEYTDYAVRTTWPDAAPIQSEPLESKPAGELLDHVMHDILSLVPANDIQHWLRDHALDVAARLIHTRWTMLIGQQGTISPVLLAIMVAWISIIFASFGLNAPRNGTVVGAFLLCALSIGTSIFLMLEMDKPFESIIVISGAPMRNALEHQRQ